MRIPDDVVGAGPAAQADLLRAGDLSSRELTQATLDAIEAKNPPLNAVVELLHAEALDQADEADRRRSQGDDGPLLGVPIAVKNELDIAGHRTSRGSRAITRVATSDAEIVQRFRALGMPMVATTTLPELATSGFTETAAFGVTRNPHDLDRTPGGSSGGSAALVAAGAVGIATASDGAGSIRIPGACSGLPAFKPSPGTTPSSGTWHGLAVQGCLTQHLSDAALFLDAIGSFDDSLVAAAARQPDRLRIGVSLAGAAAGWTNAIDPGVRAAVRRAADLLAKAGHDVREVDLRYGVPAKALTVRYLAGISDDAKAVDDRSLLQRNTRTMARIGDAFGPRAVAWACRAGDRWGGRVHDDLGVDVLLTPTMTGVAPQVGQFADLGGLRTVLAMNAYMPYTAQWNHAGVPAVSLPAGTDDGGRPLAVQLIARRGQDATLMSLAAGLDLG